MLQMEPRRYGGTKAPKIISSSPCHANLIIKNTLSSAPPDSQGTSKKKQTCCKWACALLGVLRFVNHLDASGYLFVICHDDSIVCHLAYFWRKKKQRWSFICCEPHQRIKSTFDRSSSTSCLLIPNDLQKFPKLATRTLATSKHLEAQSSSETGDLRLVLHAMSKADVCLWFNCSTNIKSQVNFEAPAKSSSKKL